VEIITIKDIAKALNLSASTVSRALRGSHEISEATKKIVLEYAKAHHYSPNPIALSLKENKSRSIGVLVPEIDNPFFSQAINGIETVCYAKGYHVLIFQSHESLEREIINLNHMISRRVDGVLISLSVETSSIPHLVEAQKRGTPIVFFDRTSDDIVAHKVVADNLTGAFEATELLIKNGKKRIAHIGASNFLSISKERLAGYKAALAKYNIPYDKALVCECNYSIESVEKEIKTLLALGNPPDALISVSDRMSIICMTIFKKLKIKVPDTLAFICFTNVNAANLFLPPISTVFQPAYEIGKKAAELLLGQIETKPRDLDKIKFETICLKTELMVRESSGQSN
jgi:LacI family transcriptional regulator